MIQIKQFNKITKKIYNDIFKDSNSPIYFDYDIINKMNSLYYSFKNKSKVSFDIVFDDDEPKLIMPVNKYKETIYLAGYRILSISDFIYKRADTKELINYLSCLFLYYKNNGYKYFKCSRMYENSETYKILEDNFKISRCEDSICTNIYLNKYNNYEDYFVTLAKKFRQNIRYSYNRIDKNNIDFKFKFLTGNKPKKLINEIDKIYAQRQRELRKYSFIKKIMSKYLHYFNLSRNHSKHFVAYIKLDDEMAAYMEGFIDDNIKELSFPRLAYNSKLKEYSPGILLVNEVAKYAFNFYKGYKLNTLLGEETYKIKFGGEPDLFKEITIEL